MLKPIAVLSAGALLVFTAPLISAIQQEEEAETHAVTVTTFKVPFSEMDDYFEVTEKYTMPSVRANPHILSYKIAVHAWGTTKHTVWIITEYEDMGAIQDSQEWAGDWFDENYPEGTAARDSADAAFEEHVALYNQDHTDNILGVSMDHVK